MSDQKTSVQITAEVDGIDKINAFGKAIQGVGDISIEAAREEDRLAAIVEASKKRQQMAAQELLAADLTDDVLHAEALALLRANPALERARAHTREVGAQAREALAGLPDSDAKAALVALVDQVVERVG